MQQTIKLSQSGIFLIRLLYGNCTLHQQVTLLSVTTSFSFL